MGYFAKKRRLNKILTSNTKTGVSKYSVKLKNENLDPEDESLTVSKKVKVIKPDKVKEYLIKKDTPSPNKSKPSTGKLDTLLPNRSQPSVSELDTKEYEGYCLFLSLTSDYIIGYRTFIQSFIEHNKWFSGDILIMALDLNDNQKEYVKSFHKKIKFIEPLYENYKDVNTSKLVNPGFVNNYYKLDIFSYTKYEKIVSMDCDMLITGDISELFFEKYSFGACEVAFSRDWDVPPFNGGLIVLDSKRNSIENYSSVLNKIDKPYRYAEQELLNEIFKKSYTRINKTYNAEKRLLKSKHYEDIELVKNAKVIHFVGAKPWDVVKPFNDLGYDYLEKKWEKAKKPRVLIVGNSPKIMDNKMGSVIDSFDIVIRINNFKIEGFEEYIGEKTTYIICTFATKITDYYKTIDPRNIFMFTAEKSGDMDFLKNRVKGVNLNKINLLSDEYLYDLNKKLNIKLPKRSTSGNIAIEFALNSYPDSNIYIHGIEFNEDTDKPIKSHYFDSDDDSGSHNTWIKSTKKYHDLGKEKYYIRKLMYDGKIIEL